MSNAPRPPNLPRGGQSFGSDNVYDRTLRLVGQHAKLKAAVVLLQQQHLQMLLVITKAAGGMIRLAKQDYAAIRGCSLRMGKDPVTGDLVLQVEEPEHEEA